MLVVVALLSVMVTMVGGYSDDDSGGDSHGLDHVVTATSGLTGGGQVATMAWRDQRTNGSSCRLVSANNFGEITEANVNSRGEVHGGTLHEFRWPRPRPEFRALSALRVSRTPKPGTCPSTTTAVSTRTSFAGGTSQKQTKYGGYVGRPPLLFPSCFASIARCHACRRQQSISEKRPYRWRRAVVGVRGSSCP